MNDESLRYPTGRFIAAESYSQPELRQCLQRIASLPAAIESVTANFSDHQFETPYREGGWSARQVVHHVADSHMNAYIRFKWALTEDTPAIKAYNEKLWAETPEVKLAPALSLNLLKALHPKWVALLESLTAQDLLKEYIHPETQKHFRLDRLMAMYAWHGDHHLGHLKIVAQKTN